MIQQPIALLVLHWLPAIMLVAALGKWPYGYYTLLRVVVCSAAVLLALNNYRRAGEVTLWCLLFVAIAILFNPLLPFHLTRSSWTILDLAACIAFCAHFLISRRPPP